MWVVKLGGSLFDSPRLPDWLHELAVGPEPVVIVPGGGPFADQVRAAQQRWPISDACAHQMALLAMDQFGEMCCALDERWRRFSRASELQGQSSRAGKWIWLPSDANPKVERSWQVTADSLAAWLAAELEAEGLLIVKSADTHGTLPLYAEGDAPSLLDDAFKDFIVNLNCPAWLINCDDYRSWQGLLAGKSSVAVKCIQPSSGISN